MKRIRSLGIVIKEGKTVLIHRRVQGNEYLVFPGGGVENGETKEEAAIREVNEETSLTVKVEKLLYVLVGENTEHYFYLCSYLSGEAKREEDVTGEEEGDSKIPFWCEMNKLKDLIVYPLEVRDWIGEDFNNDFLNPVRTLTKISLKKES